MMIFCTMLSIKTFQLNASTDVHNLLMQMYLECNFKAIQINQKYIANP